MSKPKIHLDEKPKFVIGKHIGKMGLCGRIWIETTTEISKVTCKTCLKMLE